MKRFDKACGIALIFALVGVVCQNPARARDMSHLRIPVEGYKRVEKELGVRQESDLVANENISDGRKLNIIWDIKDYPRLEKVVKGIFGSKEIRKLFIRRRITNMVVLVNDTIKSPIGLSFLELHDKGRTTLERFYGKALDYILMLRPDFTELDFEKQVISIKHEGYHVKYYSDEIE